MSNVVENLKNLVRIPSISRLSNRPVIDHAAQALHNTGWRVREMAYHDSAGVEKINLIAAPPQQDVDSRSAELAFVCHTDTVPFSPDWTKATDPFVDDGALYGCGACDVKGFLACLLSVASDVDPSKLIDGLRIVLTADEEIGCIGANRLLSSALLRPRRVVVGEPTLLRPARAGKGYCLAEVTVFGQEAHSALPHKGKSAVYRAAHLIDAIEELGRELEEEQHPFFSPEFTTLNIGTIQGGTAKNVIPGKCTFQLEWRPVPGQPADRIPAAVSRIVEKLRSVDPDFDCKIDIVRQQTGFETDAASQLVRRMETLTGRASTSIPFGSEASVFARIAEEVIVFGPGDMQTAHSARECVPLRELDEACSILRSLIDRTG
jgi:acetylornithine deacetylase